jgi:hypothetical protein
MIAGCGRRAKDPPNCWYFQLGSVLGCDGAHIWGFGAAAP